MNECIAAMQVTLNADVPKLPPPSESSGHPHTDALRAFAECLPWFVCLTPEMQRRMGMHHFVRAWRRWLDDERFREMSVPPKPSYPEPRQPMNIDTGHIVTLRVDQPTPPVGYVELTPEEVATLPRTARRKLANKGEVRLRLDHPLVQTLRKRREQANA